MKNPLAIWKNLSIQVKSSIVFLIATMTLKGLVFLTTPIFTRIMSEVDMGLVGTYNSWKGIFETFAIFSLTSAGVFNVGMSQYRDNRDKYISNMICLCACSAILTGGVVILFYNQISSLLKMPLSLVILMVLYAMIMPAQSFWIAKQRYEYKYKTAFFVVVFSALLSQVMAVVMVIASTERLGVLRLWASAMVELPIGMFFVIYLLKKGKSFFDITIWKNTLIFAIPLIPHYLSSTVLTASDRIMINILDSEAAAGIYTVVYGVGAIGSVIWGAIQGSLTPFIYDKMDNDDLMGITEVTEKSVMGFGLLCMAESLIAPEIMMVMGPEVYSSGVYAIPPVVGAIFVSCLYNIFASIEFYNKKTSFITLASITAALLNIILNLILIPIFGFVAAGYTTLASYIVLASMHYINMKRVEKRKIFNEKRLFAVSGIFLVACILPTALYNLKYVRYGVCVAIAVIAIVKRNYIIEIFKKD